MKKIIAVIVVIIAVAGLCFASAVAELSGTITEIDEYGNLVPSFKVPEVLSAGYEYGDILEVTIGNLPTMNIPFTTAYTDVGTMGICFCDYNKLGKDITIALTNADFSAWIGGRINDSISVSLAEKSGFLESYNAVQVSMTNERNDYSSDEEFANFREIKTTGIRPGTLYRASNPLNSAKNPVRYSYVSKLCEKNGINTIIDLADTDARLEPIFSTEGYDASYAKKLFDSGNVITLGIPADFFKEESLACLNKAFKFMISHKAPYLVNCNEGKDRAGAISMMLEALAGASVEEIISDYMQTYFNYYHLSKNDPKSRELQRITIEHLIYLFINPEMVKKLNTIDWNTISIAGTDIRKAIENYLINYVRLTDDEVSALKRTISK